MTEEPGDLRMTYSDLKAGDVLVKEDRPMFIVIACDSNENVFTWVSLRGSRPGTMHSPDLKLCEMWDLDIRSAYSEVLRGGSSISLSA